MNRLVLPAVPLLLGSVLLQNVAWAQPEAKPGAPTTDTYSIVELERFLGGRTLLTVDLKNANLDEIAAALSQSSGQKITAINLMGRGPSRARIIRRSPRFTPGPPGDEADRVPPPPPPPTFTLSAKDKFFWEALRGWQRDARQTTNATMGNGMPPQSVHVRRVGAAFQLEEGIRIADGRAVAVWPFLLIGTELRRGQEGRLSEEGLTESDDTRAMAAIQKAKDDAKAKDAIKTGPQSPPQSPPDAEEERWLDTLIFSLTALPDPKLKPIGFSCEVEEAIDDKGNDLRLPSGVGNAYMDTYGDMGTGMPLHITLGSKPNMGKRLVKLRGVLHFSVVTRTQHWETTDLSKPVDDTLKLEGGEFKVSYSGLTQSGNNWNLTFAAESSGSHLKQFHEKRVHNAILSNSSDRGLLNFSDVSAMQLVDDKGRTFEAKSSGKLTYFSLRPDGIRRATSSDSSPVPPDMNEKMNYQEEQTWTFFQPDSTTSGPGTDGSPARAQGASAIGTPVKLIVEFPIERRDVSVPFEFTNLPLPPS